MAKYNRMTDAERAEVFRWNSQGRSKNWIAAKLGRSVTAINWTLNKFKAADYTSLDQTLSEESDTVPTLPTSKTFISTIETVIDSNLPDGLKIRFIRNFTKETTSGQNRTN